MRFLKYGHQTIPSPVGIELCPAHNISHSKSKDAVERANHARRGKLDATGKDHVALVM
jgi:hypothetical protein